MALIMVLQWFILKKIVTKRKSYIEKPRKKSVKLSTTADIEEKVISIIKKPFPDYNALKGVQSATIDKNTICINVSNYEFEDSTDMLLSVSFNGGKLSLLNRNQGKRIKNVSAVNNIIFYLVENTEDFPISYKAKTV